MISPSAATATSGVQGDGVEPQAPHRHRYRRTLPSLGPG